MSNPVKFYKLKDINDRPTDDASISVGVKDGSNRMYLSLDGKSTLVGESVDRLNMGANTDVPDYSIVAGTNDNSVLNNILGSLASSSVTVDKPYSSKRCTLSIGSGTKVYSTGGNAIGVLNTSGVKGFYWSSIDFTNKTITLSTSQSEAEWNLPSGVTLDWQKKKSGVLGIGAYEGDTISIVNNSKYPACAKITNINGNVITVDNLPFTEIDNPTLLAPDDKTIFACYKKDLTLGNSYWCSRDGSVELGWAATAFGVENLVTGSGSFSSGWNNWSAGDFGATFGRDNISGYAGLTVGSGNISTSDSAIVTGHGNEVKGSTNALVSGGSNVVSAGQSIVGGYNNSVTDGSAGAIVGGDTNKVTSAYCTFVGGRNNTVSGAQGIISGQYVKNTGGRNLVVGDRVADTVADGETQTYTITEVTGNNNVVGGIGNTVSSNHSAAFGTRNSLTGNKGQIAAGSNNVLTNWNNAAFGRHLNVTTSAMTAVGQFNKTTTDRAMFVVGNGNANTSGAGNTSDKTSEVCDNGTTYSIVRDNAFVVYYNGSYVGGYGHTLSDGKCNAISGWGHTVSGSNSLVSGRQNTVPSSQCIVAGQSNTVQSGNSGAMGYNNTINTSCAGGFAIGTGNIVAKGNQLVCGQYCSSDTGAFFIVGNGSSASAPSNAFKVSSDGTATATKFSGNGSALTNLNASKLSSGTVPIARIPTGTTSSTVALGNHTHSNYAATSHNHSTICINNTQYTATLNGTTLTLS